MLSFRSEIENPIVQKDILDLEKKILLFREGKIDPEKFRTLRLARGVYGQRQQGVQMIRIKIPFGKISPKQLERIANVSDEYSNGHLHFTTRQDVQIHFVSLDKTPELWAKLEEDDITLREACGNTVRNITASAEAGIDANEPFDVSPYAQAMFAYFLRKPFCQELGRKIKIAFSSSEKDTAFTFIHDLGFIPRVIVKDGAYVKGFKVVIAGGLGAQPILAQTFSEFLEADEVIPFTEAVLRIFDRYGERKNRNKARLKYLVGKLGLPEFLRLVNEEKYAVAFKKEDLVLHNYEEPVIRETNFDTVIPFELKESYLKWVSTNVFTQKQKNYAGVYIKIQLGNISSDTARKLANIARLYASNDIRITNAQSLLFKYVSPQNLKPLFLELYAIGLAAPGAESTGDITACPGTDTCNLAIAGSTSVSIELEKLIQTEFPAFLENKDIKIKLSGCMNSCGQHGLAHIGFHGSSIKAGEHVVPALQLVIGGGSTGSGNGRASEKIIKVPSKRAPQVLRDVLNDYVLKAGEGESFHSYYDRTGKMYFYQLLKGHADLTTLVPHELIDWGNEIKFETAIGIGECAGVTIDLVQTLFYEANEKYELAKNSINNKLFADGAYQVYSALLNGVKALLISNGIECNTQIGLINDFEKHYSHELPFKGWGKFSDFILEINKQDASPAFVTNYYQNAGVWLEAITDFAAKQKEKAKLKEQETAKFDL
ncbi:MAG TPA: nitrite/sulfite reductase [Flavobacteriales bacterium]|nr:nitrite/sulfite reductase [Flavobacteriales bacterium]